METLIDPTDGAFNKQSQLEETSLKVEELLIVQVDDEINELKKVLKKIEIISNEQIVLSIYRESVLLDKINTDISEYEDNKEFDQALVEFDNSVIKLREEIERFNTTYSANFQLEELNLGIMAA